MKNINFFISIIIPTYNAEAYLIPCLNALKSQTFPQEHFEVIVVDNGSTDKTHQIANTFKSNLITNKTFMTVSASRNLGAKAAKGDLLAFLDSDCIAPNDWLENIALIFKNSEVTTIGCWYGLPDKANLLERTWDIISINRREHKGQIDWVPSGDLIIKKDTFEKINGFNEKLTTSEDIDICNRLIKNGEQIISDPSVMVTHLGNPKTLKDFIKKEMWRGRGVAQNIVSNFPYIKSNKAYLISILYFLLSILFLIGLLLSLIGLAGYMLDFFVLLIAILVSILLSFKFILPVKQWELLVPLALLFFCYGIARAFDLYDWKLWVNKL